MGIIVIITLFSGAGSAAPGDLLAFVTVPVPSSSCCGIGVDYDGANILYTNYLDSTVYKTDFSGANLGSVPLINPDGSGFSGGLNAIAYNFNDNMLYGGGWGSTNLYKTDLSTGVTTLVMANAIPPAFNFIDGLAWDPTDNTFWMSDDVQCNVEHLDALGNDIGGFDGCSATGLGNSGLAVSMNGFLWYGTNGYGMVYKLDTSTDPPTNTGVFLSPGGRDEDMVCGPKYTKPDGSMVETLLSKDAYNNKFAIIEVADGTCISPAAPKGSISGMKFNDLNGNGAKDMGEPGLENWTITLMNESGSMVTTVTDTSGNYSFTNITDGNYTVKETLQDGWIQTAPSTGIYSVKIAGGSNITDMDFGNFKSKDVKIAVILAEPSDDSHNASHDKNYYLTNIIPDLKDYYREVSYGAVNITINPEDVYDNNSNWYKLGRTAAYYGKNITKIDANGTAYEDGSDNSSQFLLDAVGAANSDVNFSKYDAVIVIHANKSWQQESGNWDLMVTQASKNLILDSEYELMGFWAHEAGHALGKILQPLKFPYYLPDLYGVKSVKYWDLMGTGEWLGMPAGSHPDHMSSFSKDWIGWLSNKSVGYGTYWINSLATMNYGDEITRYVTKKDPKIDLTSITIPN